MDVIGAYAGLFAAAFLAATLIPAQSEAVLLGLMSLERYPVAILLAVASIGNVLGACVNYALGRFLAQSRHLQRIVTPGQRERAERHYRRYGRWSLLASWVPIIGDPLTVVAGLMREPFAVFLAVVSIAKAGRYIALAALHQAWFG